MCNLLTEDMTRFKLKSTMAPASDLTTGVTQDIIGPDKSRDSRGEKSFPEGLSEKGLISSQSLQTVQLASRREKLAPISPSPSKLAHSRLRVSTDNKLGRARDAPVMESCEMLRTVIKVDPDKVSSSSRSYLPLTKPQCSKVNSSTSCNYTSSARFTILWIMMTISNVWRNFRHLHQHHQQHRLRYNYNHPRVNSNCLRTFTTISVIFLLLTSWSSHEVHGQPPPLPPAGFLDFDNLPVTRFSCEGKVIGGYYADVETGCQMFHVCTLGQKDEIQDIKFLCLNGTVFDQETRVCERVDEVDCSKAEQFFDLNLDLYVPHATTQKPEDTDLEEEDDNIRPVQASAGSSTKQKSAPVTTTQATTTTTTPTPSPRTRPPSSSLASRPRPPPVISGGSPQQQTSSQQEDDEDEEEDDGRGGNNAYTSFNYFLKTPHSHVASGYNSQSRQSYIINRPTASGGRGPSGPSGSSSSNNPIAATTSTGRKVPSGPGPKTIVYSSTSTSSSSTQRPKTVVVVKATLPPTKSILKPKTLATPRTTTTTTTVPPPKYELDDQYDEYYDEEDYPDQQPQPPQTKSSSSFTQTYPLSKPALTQSSRGSSGYDFRDGRSTKGVANAGQTYVSTSTGRSPTILTSSDRGKVSIAVSPIPKATPKPVLVSPASIKVISSEFIGNNSTEEPYYYEDDYPDDIALQQQQEQPRHSPGYAVTSPKSPSLSSTTSNRANILHHQQVSSSSKPAVSPSQLQSKSKQIAIPKQKVEAVISGPGDISSADYYDDDQENVNAHDHHFTHVDVPRIPFAKPNVPRVLVTNGKPFLPRLRRQSHYMNYFNPAFPPPLQSRRQPYMRDLLLPAESVSRPLQRSTASLLHNNFHIPPKPHPHPQTHPHHHPHQGAPLRRPESRAGPVDHRAKELPHWGRDPHPFR